MWWRVAQRSPFNSDKANGADTRYKIWKTRVSKGFAIDRPYKPQFTWGWMDSVQNGSIPLRNKFKSDYRENDTPGFQGEGNPETEMLWDDVFFPGTRIEYFVTSNYVGTPTTLYYLPDTTGQFYFEVEVLPGNHVAKVANCGGTGLNYCVYHPATLYIDAYNGGSQFYIENALRTILNGYQPCTEENGCKIPPDRNWDRYDYFDSASNFNVPFSRGTVAGSNNGMTLNQILGYRAILTNAGTIGSGNMEDQDFVLFDDWLSSALCNANVNRQLLVFNGDQIGQMLMNPNFPYANNFISNTLGASLFCDAFNGFSDDPDCAPEETAYCVRWLPVQGGPFGTASDVDLYGSYCPNKYGFNVYSQAGTGIGNRYYSADGGTKQMQYAQVTNQNLSGNANWRTIIDGGSWHHMTQRNATGVPDFCPRDTPSIVAGSLSEIGAAMKWGFGVADYSGIPKLTSVEEIARCQGTWTTIPSEVGDDTAGSLNVNRLYQNTPNPFNPRTQIKFSLAQSGPVQISIFDVNGRLVKTLVNGTRTAGTYTEVWDGTNDLGKKVGSGVYWSQMKAGSFVSNKKMVILK